jgi:hypothetical protein
VAFGWYYISSGGGEEVSQPSIGEERQEERPSPAMAVLRCGSFEFWRAPAREWTLGHQGEVGAVDGRLRVEGMEHGGLGHVEGQNLAGAALVVFKGETEAAVEPGEVGWDACAARLPHDTSGDEQNGSGADLTLCGTHREQGRLPVDQPTCNSADF